VLAHDSSLAGNGKGLLSKRQTDSCRATPNLPTEVAHLQIIGNLSMIRDLILGFVFYQALPLAAAVSAFILLLRSPLLGAPILLCSLFILASYSCRYWGIDSPWKWMGWPSPVATVSVCLTLILGSMLLRNAVGRGNIEGPTHPSNGRD
jgi:hypothetical protein